MAEPRDLAANEQLAAQIMQQQRAVDVARKRLCAQEMESLQQQIDALQARLQTLEEAKALRISFTDVDELHCAADQQLRDAVNAQLYTMASVQSALGGYVSKMDRPPHDFNICLGEDREERHVALVAMKGKVLEEWLRYLAVRTIFLDSMTPQVEAYRFVEPSGAFCSMPLDITQFEGVQSARQVFDALKFFFFNMEISISELIRFLTIREDDGAWQDGVFESRITSNVIQDVQMEMNTAMFSAFYDEYGGGRPIGVIAADFVNVDELYPYSPAERVRYDVTGVLSITEEIKARVNENGEEEGELVVVLKRSSFIRIQPSDLPFPPPVLQALRDGISKFEDVILTKIKEIVSLQLSTR